ncbi:peptidase C26 [Lamprobacter modestohalophilus]|uniref:Peptidase C26 n=1 Tax=Lamprobacter modestohalophilus TaxID=1064514 RepID=A0A9X0W7L9_9GAMM|nr:gamma-glutamyl-gamma-aminobutyrate hydrolase family protein [Lamprobacter modestohalophilus]MBK1618322.1 peptidase C26 [Lamprobacter modestohalophilus]MCF7995699.1 gamma-glutamyl-gamma-aminobutyrate hydrolase family protein [Chromatiaceae bacterium]MCF8015390.1 gamma-glutamyl-gamma-aminobutyrate hydrolase family protein [Chromatiaceae bacterium]
MAQRQRTPLIAVTGPTRGSHAPKLLVQLALRLAGARTTLLTPANPKSEIQDTADGIVITGGHDVDPVLYAAAPEVTPKYDPERDALESAVIDRALERGLPVLGICRGAQLLNVRLGGNLFQELRSRRKHTSNRWTIFPLKTLCIEPGTELQRLMSSDRARINSLHNQGIDRLGEGLIIAGRDLDGIIQAIEAPLRHCVRGVQWHPEFLLYNRGQRQLFNSLVAAARLRNTLLETAQPKGQH